MMWSSRVPAPIAWRFWRTGWWWKRERRRRCSIGRAMRRRARSSRRLHRRRLDPRSSLPFPPRALPRAGLVLLFVVEFVVQIVVLVEVVQVLVLELVLIQVVVEVLVEALVLFEFLEILFVETVAATLERPVRRVTGQHCHPLLGLWLNEPCLYDSSPARVLRASLRRSVAPNARLRSRIDDGVTSINSSSSMYSSASSNVTCRGGSRMIISSDAVVRMFVSFFSFAAFTSMSSGRALSPTIIPSYTGSPGRTNSVPRSWRLNSAKATATPSRSATSTPRLRPEIGPPQGPYS